MKPLTIGAMIKKTDSERDAAKATIADLLTSVPKPRREQIPTRLPTANKGLLNGVTHEQPTRAVAFGVLARNEA